MKTIGLIGPGIMGTPMGLNLIKSGYSLKVYARRRETAKILEKAGAEFIESPAQLADKVDAIISIVSDTPDVETVLLGEEGVIHGGKSGLLVIDMSTISPVATQDIADQLNKHGIHMLDAPVSGGDIGAKEATLTIMVGGNKEDFDRAYPLFQAMGKTITHIGNHGSGQLCKACNQLIVAQNIIAISEAFSIAKAANVDPSKIHEALLGGFASSRVMEVHAQRILDDTYLPGFKAKLHNKDMRIVADTAKTYGLSLSATELACDFMQKLINNDGGELDSAAIAREVFKKASGDN